MKFRNILLDQMTEKDAKSLGDSMSEVSLSRETRLANEGESPQYIFFPSTCVTSVVTVMRDGRAVETSTIGCESAPAILPAITGEPTRHRVFVQIPGSAMRIPAIALRKHALASPDFMMLLLRFAQANAYQAELSVACNALHLIPGAVSPVASHDARSRQFRRHSADPGILIYDVGRSKDFSDLNGHNS